MGLKANIWAWRPGGIRPKGYDMDLEVGMRSLSWTMNLGFQVGIRVLRLGFVFQGGGRYKGFEPFA